MARPHKDGDDKRVLTVRIRVTSTERNRIWQLAAESGHTPSDFMRLRTMAATKPLRRVPTPDRKILLDLMAELGKLESNVNQFAHVLNSRDESGQLTGVSPEDISHAMQSVDALTGQLLNLLDHGH